MYNIPMKEYIESSIIFNILGIINIFEVTLDEQMTLQNNNNNV